MLALVLIAALQDNPAEFRREARALLEASHRLLDAGDYERAVDAHRRGRLFEARARETLDLRLTAVLPLLDDEDYRVREDASARLLALGPVVRPRIDALLLGSLSAEVRCRLQDVAVRLAAVAEDVDGRLRQWAVEATASSEYEAERWSAKQAAGAPDSAEGSDQATAWASKQADGAEEWLELRYAMEVRPLKIRIHETYNPGAVVRIEAVDAAGARRPLWAGTAAAREGGGWMSIELPPGGPATRALRLTLDSGAVAGWNEIDAVELIGESAF